MTTGFKCSRCGEFEPIGMTARKSIEDRIEELSISIHDPWVNGRLCDTCREGLQVWMNEVEREQ